MPNLDKIISNLTSGNDLLAEQASAHLSAMGEASLSALRLLLDSPQPDTRWWVIRTLASIKNPTVPSLLVKNLQDPDLSIKQCTLIALREQADPETIPILIQMLSSCESLIARLAGDALIHIGEPAVFPLIEIFENGTPATRIEAIRALALIGDPRAIPALYSAYQSDSALIEYWADEGLERMKADMLYLIP